MDWNSDSGGNMNDFHAFKSTSGGSGGGSGCLGASATEIIVCILLVLWLFSKCS